MFRLPISSLKLGLRQPAGWEELLLDETQDSGIGVLLALLERIAEPADGAPIEWGAVPVRDLDLLVLLLRRSLLGDLIVSDARCTAAGCGAAVDVSFRIGAYLKAQLPQTPAWVEAEDESGWFR